MENGKRRGGSLMDLTIRKAARDDFADVYELICELCGSPVGGMSFGALERIYQANLLNDSKGL